ncbi:MAG TPA: ABATE domain-containing protein [Vicinamibacterales bacterium]|nr:ABATE domain-containing protein [Vicinamibacterales bacterium]
MVTPHTAGSAGSADRSQPDYRFDFCGGHVALDFANTVGSRGDRPEDHLNTYGDLIAWAEARGVVTRTDAGRLKRAAAAEPDAARAVFRRAIRLRETLYHVFLRRTSGRAPAADDLATLNAFVADTYRDARLAVDGDRIVLETGSIEDDLERPFAPVVRAAVDLLTGDRATLVGRCADESCGWLFLDTSRNRTRRWCVMKDCGNRAKVRRFRGRTPQN